MSKIRSAEGGILASANQFMVIACIISAVCITGCKKEPVDLRIKKMDPAAAAAMAKTIEERVNPELSEGLTLSLWGVDSLVADPISIDIDDKGRVYYVRTNRQKHSEFDIRRHQDWEIGSIQLQTVEDKREFLHKVLSPEKSAENEWMADLNGDGSHDWRDMTVEKEHVYRVEDVSGDGVADLTQLVLEDFHDEVTDVAGAIIAHDGDIFVGVAPDLWRIKDKNGDGIADEKTSISHGYGIHVGFSGHGMSGLEMGPDGKLYWGIGDIGFNGKGPDGKEWKYPNRGVIVRANPDGSDFEVFAMGVRNTHEFVFDEYGNLISVDNDGDHPGEKERLVYIVNGSDTGWRINWQFGKYRDPDNNRYKVWMDEEMYKPRFEGQAAYITPAIANYVSGPAGMLYNPGTALGPEYKNTFFISEFVGNPAGSGIHAFKLKPKGATFEFVESEMILKGVLATGIDFGPDGAMYVADWIEGWGTKNHGRIWKLDTKDGANSPERQETKKLLAEDFTKHTPAHLGEVLKNPDMRVRQKAQFELVKRGADGAEILKEYMNSSDNQLARIHGIWGVSQLARENAEYADLLIPLLKDNDPEIRAQAAKWLGDVRHKAAGSALIPLLQDKHSRARFFAAEALGRIAYEPAINPLIAFLEANNDEDAFIRHAGSLALARIGKAAPIVALSEHPSDAVRMAAVISLRRLQDPGIVNFLDDENEYIVTEAARAINDDYSIEKALPALGNLLQQPKFKNEPLIRRAINANLRVGSEQAKQNLINYAQLESAPVEMRNEAIAALSTWAKPSVLDRVDGRYRGVIERDPAELKLEATDPLIALSSNKDFTIRLHAVEAIGKLKIDNKNQQLLAILGADKEAAVRKAALEALVSIENAPIDKAIEQALSDKNKEVRIAALDLLGQTEIAKDLKVNLLSEVIEKRTTEEKQAALLTLGTLPVENSKPVLENLLTQLEAGKLPPEIHLEFAEAIDSSNSTALIERYQAINATLASDSNAFAYEGVLFGGDAERGRRIFFSNQTAQCMRCHSFDDFGGNAGPRINGVAGKLSRQELLEALVDPHKRIAPGFGTVTLSLNNGETVRGMLQAEDASGITVKAGNAPDTLVLKKDIANRVNGASSMPNMGQLLTKREIRDLVSFLATQEVDEMVQK